MPGFVRWATITRDGYMVAIVSGSSLGLGLTSLNTLGGSGLAGSALQGSSGERAYVNVANGNLILQDIDESLIAPGRDLYTVRTYNSLGVVSGSDGAWRLGVYRSVNDLTGTLNSAGSTVTRTDGDGTVTRYAYDAVTNTYLSEQGADARDSLYFDERDGACVWTDGATGVTELYNWADGAGQLASLTDTNGRRITFDYDVDGRRLCQVNTEDEVTSFEYDGENLVALHVSTADRGSLTRVRYAYDGDNRLTSVTVDLSPEDDSIADGNTYVTSYRYFSESNRLQSVLQSDGSRLDVDYVQCGDDWRVATLTQTVGGVAQTTRYSYADVLNAIPVAAAVGAGVLSTTEMQMLANSASVNAGALSTSGTQTNTVNASLSGAKLSSGAILASAQASRAARSASSRSPCREIAAATTARACHRRGVAGPLAISLASAFAAAASSGKVARAMLSAASCFSASVALAATASR